MEAAPQEAVPPKAEAKPQETDEAGFGWQLAGWVWFVSGVVGLAKAVMMDTAPLGTNNIGLISDRETALIVSATGAITGVLFMLIGAVRALDRNGR